MGHLQHLLGSVANGQAFFVRAAVHTGVFGLLAAFAAGYAVYGAGLLAATVALKWALVGRMPAGRHKCALTQTCVYWQSAPVVILYVNGCWLGSVWCQCTCRLQL